MGRKQRHNYSKMRRVCSILLMAALIFGCLVKMPTVSARAAGDVEINEENFPDAGFRELIGKYDKDKNGILSANEISDIVSMNFMSSHITEHEILSTKGINALYNLRILQVTITNRWIDLDLSGCKSLESLSVSNGACSIDLSGCTSLKSVLIPHSSIYNDIDFSTNTNLETLMCPNSGLGLLDVSHNTKLKNLQCNGNEWLHELDVSNNKDLLYLNCSSTGLETLNLSNNTKLINLNCSSNGLTELDLNNNTALESLNCSDNGLEVLNISNCKKLQSIICSNNHLNDNLRFSMFPDLKFLNCSQNMLYTLDLSTNPLLEELDCHENQIQTLNVSKSLQLYYLNCNGNSLESLDVTNFKELVYLDCGNNHIQTINISNNPWLDYFNCSSNYLISSLNLENNHKLAHLNCGDNNISSLNVSNNPRLNELICNANKISSLNLTKNEVLETLICNKNQLSSLDLSNNRYLHSINIAINKIKSIDITKTQLEAGDILIDTDLIIIDNSSPVAINTTNFPDDILRSYVDNLDKDKDGALSKSEAKSYFGGDVYLTGKVTSLKGLEYLPLCKSLTLYGDSIDQYAECSLDLSKNKIIRSLYLSPLIADEIDLTNAPLLETLSVTKTYSKIDISNCSRLRQLYCCSRNLPQIELFGSVYLRKGYRSYNFRQNPNYLVDSNEWNYWMITYYPMSLNGNVEIQVGCETELVDGSDFIEILTQPESIEVYENESADFSVSAKGNGIKYLWQYFDTSSSGWVDWTSMTTNKINVAYSPSRDGMYVRCIITDSNGYKIATTPVQLNYKEKNPLTILSNPSDVTVKVNETATFEIKASGSGLKYMWQYKNADASEWTDWTSKTSASISVAYAAYRNGMSLRCVVTDAKGKQLTSKEAILKYTGLETLEITTQPKNTTVDQNALAYFSVQAKGSGLKYLWQYKEKGKDTWTDWTSKTTASISVAYAANRDGMSFRCVVTDSTGKKLTSNAATLTYNKPLTITKHPSNTSVNENELASFEVTATGKGLKYLWQYKEAGKSTWTDWSSKTTAKISVAYASYRDGMSFRCVVTDSTGTKLTSNAATLTYIKPLKITKQPSNTTVNEKELAYFEINATGKGLKYLWQYKEAGKSTWTDWTSKTTAKISVAYAASRNGMSLRCVVTDSTGAKVTSNTATLTYTAPFAITRQPANASVDKNTLASFSVKATGKGLKYQWQYKLAGDSDWTTWSSKTTADITVAYAAFRNGMSLRCVITDASGNKITSNVATLSYK